MPNKKLNISGSQADVLSWVTHELAPDETAMLRNVSRLPCIYKHVALMPDAHLGKGSMVGSVIATKDAVIPATVGVDIGCGMMAVKTPFKSGILDRKRPEFRHEIERAIPVGFNDYKEPVDESNEWDGWSEFDRLHKGVQDRKRKAMKQLGTLGGGNHFIERRFGGQHAARQESHLGRGVEHLGEIDFLDEQIGVLVSGLERRVQRVEIL